MQKQAKSGGIVITDFNFVKREMVKNIDRLKIFIIAGEPSGDVLGGKLMSALKDNSQKEIEFVGIGGTKMEEQGLKSLFPISELSIMGFAEIVPHIPKLLGRIKQAADAIINSEAQIVITIDSPDFCFRVIKKLKQNHFSKNIKKVHLIAPSVWAYRPKRAKKIAKLYDLLLAILPFEPPYFERHGLETVFIGHPITENVFGYELPKQREFQPLSFPNGNSFPLERGNIEPPSFPNGNLDRSKQPFGAVLPAKAVAPSPINRGNIEPPSFPNGNSFPLERGNIEPPSFPNGNSFPLNRGNIEPPSFPNGNSFPLNRGNINFRERNQIKDDDLLICAMAGSRIGEVKRILPEIIGGINLLAQKHPNLVVVMPIIERTRQIIQEHLQLFNVRVILIAEDQKYPAFKASNLAIAKSGTNNLEIAIAQLPMITIYKINPITHFFVKRMVKIQFANLINLILNQELIPELLQDNCCAKKIASIAENLISNPQFAQRQISESQNVLKILGLNSKVSPSKKAALKILSYFQTT